MRNYPLEILCTVSKKWTLLKNSDDTLLISVNQSEPHHKEEYVNISTSRVSDEQDEHGKWRKIRDKCMKSTQVSYFFSFSNACHVSCVLPTSLKLGCIPYDPGLSARPISTRKHTKKPTYLCAARAFLKRSRNILLF